MAVLLIKIDERTVDVGFNEHLKQVFMFDRHMKQLFIKFFNNRGWGLKTYDQKMFIVKLFFEENSIFSSL